MREASIRVSFAKRHDLWYDVETGDLLTTKSARALTSSQRRILDKSSHVLAANDMQLRSFLEAKEECVGNGSSLSCHPRSGSQRGPEYGLPSKSRGKGNQPFDLDLIEAWSDQTLAILSTSDAIKEELDVHDIMAYEADTSIGKVLLVDRELKTKVIPVLTKMGAQISFVSKEATEQSFRSKTVMTVSAELPMKRQDRFFQIVQDNVMLTMVFDGHGTNNVIEFISSNYYDLATIIEEPFPETQGEALSRTREAFKKFEVRIKQVQNAPHSGSTLVLAAHKLSTKQCFFAHIGDSRAVWMLSDGQSGATEDHKPNLPSERKRIEEAGGAVTQAAHDAYRVSGILATSRSFGDTALKVPLNKHQVDFVSNIPDVNGPFTFTSGSFYALGSDGVFDVVQSREVIQKLQEAGPSNAHAEIQALAQLARARGSRDDITLVSVFVL